MKFDVLNRLTGDVQFTASISCENKEKRSVKLGLAVVWALNNKADLRGADLRGADLRRANLHGADLRGANLHEADLRGADLYGADLHGANLYGANLYGANLHGANLHEASLHEADLHEANLRGADLRRANLHEADLRRAEGVYSFGPVGEHRRRGVIFLKDGNPTVILGCFCGSEREAINAINKKYGKGSAYASAVRAMCRAAKDSVGG